MWNSPQQILQLRLTVCDTDRPIERVIALDADARLESLHDLIQAAFTWTGHGHRHFFTDTRSVERQDVRDSGRCGHTRTQRVWEMEHGCRNGEHISLCEWNSSVSQALSAVRSSAVANGAATNHADRPQLYYEYAVRDGRRAHDYNDCGLVPFELCNDHWLHGWTIAIEELERRKPQRSEQFPALLDGCGRSPLMEVGGARGDAALNALLDTPTHPRHAELDAWVRGHEGPWAAHACRAFDPKRFDIGAAAFVFGSGHDTYEYGYGQRAHRAVVGGVQLSADAASAASTIPRRHRVDVFSAALRLALENPTGLKPETTRWLTAPLAALLHRIAAADGAPSGTATANAEHNAGEKAAADVSAAPERGAVALRTAARCETNTGVSEIFARSLRLVVRRSGEFRLTAQPKRATRRPLSRRGKSHLRQLAGLLTAMGSARKLLRQAQYHADCRGQPCSDRDP